MLTSFLKALLRLPTTKGILGEGAVRLGVWLALDKRVYHSYHNITLSTRDGTTQIDHVIVSAFGVFVIETKNMTGKIFGSERDVTWTQMLGRKTYQFQNPLRQNFKHVKAIEESLDLDPKLIHPMIIFVGDAELMKEAPVGVTCQLEALSYIKRFKDEKLSDSEVDRLCMRIESVRLAPDLRTHFAHVAHVEETKTQAAVSNVSSVCPKCGGKLILRTAQRGSKTGSQFFGCDRFPKCRYTRS